jgi:hypothetical protein
MYMAVLSYNNTIKVDKGSTLLSNIYFKDFSILIFSCPFTWN